MKNVLALLSLVLAAPLSFAADVTLTDAQLDPAFAKADRNRNGTVSQAEARRFGLTGKAFRQANPDKDGSLDKAEFAATVTAQFTAANPDKDGTLDWREAQKAGIKSKKVFSAAHPDNDGSLDLAEFLAALTAQAR